MSHTKPTAHINQTRAGLQRSPHPRRLAVHAIAAVLGLSLVPLATTTRGTEAGGLTNAMQIAKRYRYGSSTGQSASGGKPYDPDSPEESWTKGRSRERLGSGIRSSTGYHPKRTKNFWKHYHTNTKPEKKPEPLDREK